MRLALGLLTLCLSSPVFAGDFENFAPCSKSNQCKSLQCFQKRCEPSGTYNGRGKDGTYCETNSNCASRNCDHRHCAPKKEEKKKETARSPQQHSPSSTGHSSPAAQEDGEEEESTEPVAVELPPLPPPTPCTDSLAPLYKDVADADASLRARFQVCLTYSPEVVEQARVLATAGYGRNPLAIARTVKESTPEQIACTRKQLDTEHAAGRHPEFEVPAICKQSLNVQACAEDLSATVFKDEKRSNGIAPKAQTVCSDYAPEVIVTSKKLFQEGFSTSFTTILGVVKKATPAQLDCAKREYEFSTAGRTKYDGFKVPSVCEKPQEVIDCYFSLLDTDFAAVKYDDRARSEVVGHCQNSTPEQRALISDLKKAGFTQRYGELREGTKKLTQKQYPCVRASLKKATADEKGASHWYPPKTCNP